MGVLSKLTKSDFFTIIDSIPKNIMQRRAKVTRVKRQNSSKADQIKDLLLVK